MKPTKQQVVTSSQKGTVRRYLPFIVKALLNILVAILDLLPALDVSKGLPAAFVRIFLVVVIQLLEFWS